MSYCLNPQCQRPQNNALDKFCTNCGSKLLLCDRYRAIKAIGQGGFGRTFLAVDEFKPSKTPCVIKQFYPQNQGTNTSDKAAILFEQEAIRLDELGHHPQIPNLLAYFSQDGRQYLILQYIDGQNLAEELEKQGVFSESKIRQLLQEMLLILKFIHKGKVIHRDIKPENIIRNSEGFLTLVDFGAAKILTNDVLGKTGTVIGSAGFVSPEQAVGRAVYASDIYSLGVTCLYLMTQIHPFDLFSTLEDDWVWDQYLTTPISQGLKNILNRMVAVDLSSRYRQVNDVLEDLARLDTRNSNNSSANQSPFSSPHISIPQISINIPNPVIPDIVIPKIPEISIPSISVNIPDISINKNNSNQLWKCQQTLVGHRGVFAGVNTVLINDNIGVIVSGSDDNTIKLWRINTGKEIRCFRGHDRFVRSLVMSPDRTKFYSSANDGFVKIWTWENEQEIGSIAAHNDSVGAIALSPDGEILATASDDYTIKLWQLSNYELINTFTGHNNYVQALKFTPDGQYLVSGSCDNTIKIWGIQNFTLKNTLSSSNWIQSLTISNNGQTIITGNFGNELQFWDFHTGSLRKTLTGHKGWMGGIYDVIISPDGQFIFSAGHDQTIKIWDYERQEFVTSLTGHLKAVQCLAFTQDGQYLVSGSADKTIKIWTT